jgi:putative superfamily III holin-X
MAVMATGNLDHQDEQAGQLISGVLHDARDLALAEVDKLKAEAITQVKSAGEGAKYGGAGVLLLAMAVMTLGVAIASGLAAAGLAWWLALGLVALAYGGAGAGLLKLAAGRRRRPVNGAGSMLS